MTPVFVAGGSVQAQEGYVYVSRAADNELLNACRSGGLAYVLDTRQVGKSSLMIHTAERLIEEGWSVAIVDLTSIGANITAEQWYRGILVRVADETDIDLDAAAWWDNNGQLGPTDRFSRFFREVLIEKLRGRRIAVFFDEIDSTLALPFRGRATDDFFAALRALHLGRAGDRQLTRLSIVLLGVAEPSDLIADPERTPFNIGQRIELRDFTEGEAAALLPNSGVPAQNGAPILREVLAWTGGHPYLTLRVFRSFQDRPLAEWTDSTVDERMVELFKGPASEDDSNLRFVRDMLLVRAPDKAAVLEKYIAVVKGKRVADEPSQREIGWLKLSGLVRERSGWLENRNRVYREIFTAEWAKERLPAGYWKALFQRRVTRSSPWILAMVVLFYVPALLYQVKQEQINALIAQDRQKTAEGKTLETRRQTTSILNMAREAQINLTNANLAEKHAEELASAAKDRYTNTLANSLTARSNESGAYAAPLLIESVRRKVTEDGVGGLATQITLQRHVIAKLSHQNHVNAAAFSPDGKTVATASDDNTVRLWDAATGQTHGILSFQGPVNAVAFSPDGKTIAAASSDHTARLCDAATGRSLTTLSHQSSVNAVAFSLDSKIVATASSDNTARLWDVATGQARATLSHQSWVNAVAFSPDRTTVATASYDHTARLWDAATGQLRATLGHQLQVTAVAFSPDGRIVATASLDHTARLWDAATGQERATLSHQLPVNAVAFSPDGKTVATASSDDTARLWDAATAQPGATLKHQSSVSAIAFSPDGKTVATASSDNTARLWDAATGQARATLSHQSSVNAIAFSPDGKTVATASDDNTARLWDAIKGQARAALRFRGPVNEVAFSQDGKTVATASSDHTARLWDAATGQERATLSHQSSVNAVAFSPNGKTVATASSDHTARLWDAATGQVRATLSHQSSINAVAFSPDGKTVATASSDNTARLWDAATGQAGATLRHQLPVTAVAFSPDGKTVATASFDHTARLWDAATGQARATLSHRSPVTAVAFSPDGKTIATASVDNIARLWNAATGQERATLSHQSSVTAVAFSPDGKTVATASFDNTARLWDAATGQARATLRHQSSVDALAFSPDSRLIFTVSGNEVQFYLYRPADLVQVACEYLPFNLTRAVWNEYMPDEPYRRTCPNVRD